METDVSVIASIISVHQYLSYIFQEGVGTDCKETLAFKVVDM